MHDSSPTLSQGFVYYFDDFLEPVQTLADDLSETEFWGNPFAYGNSIGHLVLHYWETPTIRSARSLQTPAMYVNVKREIQ